MSSKITFMIHSAGTAAAEGGIAVRVFSLQIVNIGFTGHRVVLLIGGNYLLWLRV